MEFVEDGADEVGGGGGGVASDGEVSESEPVGGDAEGNGLKDGSAFVKVEAKMLAVGAETTSTDNFDVF